MNLLSNIKTIINKAHGVYFKQTNHILLKMYWDIGKTIVEDEQAGFKKAEYGKKVLPHLATQLTLEYGKGFDERNLNNMRAFYRSFPIWNAVRSELSWTHYRILSRIEDKIQRIQYLEECIAGHWNTRSLQRNIDSHYLSRMLKTSDSKNESSITAKNFIKDPYILEFAGLQHITRISESHLEEALIQHIRDFLMELGKGFAFVARQQRISTDTADFFIDLVFYNFYMKCFVLIDLKTHKLTHQDIGQMDMYVRMYNELHMSKDDNPAIGLILCTDKDETIVKYSVMSENEKIFASKYRLYLPDTEEIRALIENDRMKFDLDNESRGL